MIRLVVASTLTLLVLSSQASADQRPVPAADWNDATRLTLAQVMVGEADWHEPDHVAIAFVLARRWLHYRGVKGPITFQRYMQLYSSTMKVDTERARWVRSLAWGDADGPHGKRWRAVQLLVEAWGQGKVKNPCPNAEHWGGAMDRPGSSFEPVTCGLTKNIFYAARDKPVLAVKSTASRRGRDKHAAGRQAKEAAADERMAEQETNGVETAPSERPRRVSAGRSRRAQAARRREGPRT